MKRKGLINKNVIAAMSLALSATMAMTPVATLAEETVDPTLNTGNTNTESSDAGQAVDGTVEAETAAADAQADTTQNAAESADQAVGDLLSDVLGGDNAASSDDGGSTAADSVGAFVDAAQDLADDKTLKGAVNDLKDANDKIDDAEKADQAIADALSDGGTGVSIANDVANATETNVNKANEDADNIIASIQDSDATQEQVQAAVDQIDKLYDQTEKEVAAAKQTVADLSDRYDAAKLALEKAEKDFNDSIGKAGADVQSAKTNLENAQHLVSDLETALSDAQSDLAAEEEAAETIADLEKALKGGNDWNSPRELVQKALIPHYIIPQLIDPEATDISITRSKGFTGQDSTRYIATYKDKNGASQVAYFNYDKNDRNYNNNGNQWYSLGSDKYITIYEKTAEEVAADEYAMAYYSDVFTFKDNEGKRNTQEFKNDVKNGVYDVFAYEEDGQTKFVMRDELNKNDGVYTLKDGEYYKGQTKIELRQIKQSTAATATGLKINIKTDEELNAFIVDAEKYLEKYNAYTEATEAAKTAVETAQTEVDNLNDAISELQETHSTRLAKDVLGVEDVASYFELNNITADEAGMLNEMTVDEVVKYFDELLQKAKDKVDNAELKLKDLQAKLTEAEGELDKMMIQISPDAVMDLLEDPAEEAPADDYAAVADSAADTTAAPAATAAQTVPAGAAQTTPAASTTQTTPAGAAQVGGFAAAVEAAANAENVAGGVLGLARAEEGAETLQASNDEAPATNIFVNTIKENETKSEGDLVTINAGQTALSGTLGDPGADAVATSWWWAMIIALFGAAGREMYKKHQEKMEAREKANSEK